MFCTNCGSKLEEGSKFCHCCGTSTKESVSSTITGRSDQNRETKEGYLSRTGITLTKEEAKKYLRQTRSLFWLVFLALLMMRALSLNEETNDQFLILFFIFLPFYFILLIYFIFYCTKVLKAEHISRANALWCVFFAPLSWLYLYPLITDPLKIIIGKKQPPILLNKEERRKRNKKSWRNFWIMIGFLVVIFILTLLYLLYF